MLDTDRNPTGFLRRLKESGHPVVLTINGQAELVVGDLASYDTLIELAERAEQRAITERSGAEIRAGLGRPADAMLAEMRAILEAKPSA